MTNAISSPRVQHVTNVVGTNLSRLSSVCLRVNLVLTEGGENMENWVIMARKPGKRGGRGSRKPRAQGIGPSGHAVLRMDGVNIRKTEGGRFPRKVVTRNGVELTVERHAPIEGVRSVRNPK